MKTVRTAKFLLNALVAAVLAGAVTLAQDDAKPDGPPDGERNGRRDGPPEAMRHPRPGMREMTPPRAARGRPEMMLGGRIMQRLQEENPEEFRRLMQLRQENPEQFQGELRDLVRRRMQKRAGAGRNHENQALNLARQYREAESEEDKARLRDELEQSVRQAFDADLSQREEMVENMERKITELRQMLVRRRENKTRICADRVEELLRDPELKWNMRGLSEMHPDAAGTGDQIRQPVDRPPHKAMRPGEFMERMRDKRGRGEWPKPDAGDAER